MCSIITHPAVPLALSGFLPQENVSPALLLADAVCSIVPDLDVVGFSFGIRYGDILGHRGFYPLITVCCYSSRIANVYSVPEQGRQDLGNPPILILVNSIAPAAGYAYKRRVRRCPVRPVH